MKEWYLLNNTSRQLSGRTTSKKTAGKWLQKHHKHTVTVVNDNHIRKVTNPKHFIPDAPERIFTVKIKSIDVWECPWCGYTNQSHPETRRGDIIRCSNCHTQFILFDLTKDNIEEAIFKGKIKERDIE